MFKKRERRHQADVSPQMTETCHDTASRRSKEHELGPRISALANGALWSSLSRLVAFDACSPLWRATDWCRPSKGGLRLALMFGHAEHWKEKPTLEIISGAGRDFLFYIHEWMCWVNERGVGRGCNGLADCLESELIALTQSPSFILRRKRWCFSKLLIHFWGQHFNICWWNSSVIVVFSTPRQTMKSAAALTSCGSQWLNI